MIKQEKNERTRGMSAPNGQNGTKPYKGASALKRGHHALKGAFALKRPYCFLGVKREGLTVG